MHISNMNNNRELAVVKSPAVFPCMFYVYYFLMTARNFCCEDTYSLEN